MKDSSRNGVHPWDIERPPSYAGLRNSLVWHGSVFLVALLIRLFHNGFLMESPLYFLPLGGQSLHLDMAEKIVAGSLIPLQSAFSVNSPIYPYILALIYRVAGVSNYLAVRLVGILCDSVTCTLIADLSRRRFGTASGVISGVLAACYGPMVFYSTDLVAVPFTLFFITLAVWLIDRGESLPVFLLAGISLGLGVGTRPDILPLALLLAPVPLISKARHRWKMALLILAGVGIAISPISTINYLVSKKFVLLTTSAGHNFYIGHNPHAKAGYYVPDRAGNEVFRSRGDVFHVMKDLAEKAEGRPIPDHEVSAYYFRKALAHIAGSPLSEARLLLERLALAFNHVEYTTYSDYRYQQEISPILTHALTMGCVFPLAFLGMIWACRRENYSLFIPIVTSLLTTLIFFHISRLRMPMAPFLIVFAGHGVATLWEDVKGKRWKRTISALALSIPAFAYSNMNIHKADSSNEWNKVGVIYRIQKRYSDAEAAFLRAVEENPLNPNSYLNLSVLYRDVGEREKADGMAEKAKGLTLQQEERAYLEALRVK